MKLGINTYTFMWSIGFQFGDHSAKPEKPMTAMNLLEKACELGVKVVQIGPNLPLDRLPEAELDEFIQAAKEWAIELELGTRGLETDHLNKQLDLCCQIGSKLLRTIPELGGQSAPVTKIPDYLRKILPRLEEDDLVLALENGKIPSADMKWAIDESNSPRVGIVLDMVNSLAVPEGWKQVTQVLAPSTMCLHFKDFIIRREWHMMGFICEGAPAGQGQLDTEWLLETLKASPYDFNVIVELWPPEQSRLADTIALEHEWAAQSIPFLRQYIPN